jgi:hypothetical protein
MKISKEILICPKCNEIIIDDQYPLSCPNCHWKKSFILKKVIDIKYLSLLSILSISLILIIYKQITASATKMTLVNEYKEKWTIYQYFIDGKGKKHIKMISADPDWMNNEIFYMDIHQDDNLDQKIKNSDSQTPKYFIDWIKNQFANKNNWKKY